MPRRLKYKIINPDSGRTMHHSFNKKNADDWVKENRKNKPYRIKKI